jgi:hypothetical protein
MRGHPLLGENHFPYRLAVVIGGKERDLSHVFCREQNVSASFSNAMRAIARLRNISQLIKLSESWDFKNGKRILRAVRTRTMQRGQPEESDFGGGEGASTKPETV